MEQVVLLDTEGRPCGSAPKMEIHGSDTPLHLAFSCYLQRDDGDLLVTRRALSKLTWPGVWTNSFCGHPAPGEAIEDAVHRRAHEELGTKVTDVTLRLPEFRYRAVDDSGTVENEICPVFTARLAGDIDPDASEIAQFDWVSPSKLHDAVLAAPFAFSPWMQAQLPQLMALDALAAG